ncbi:MAG: c-type cytochrome [Pseudomonadales bacterium]
MTYPARSGLCLLTLLCTALLALPGQAASRDRVVERGEYLVNLLGCGRCHTEGYLTADEAAGPMLAGSRVGIAYTGDDGTAHPGLVFAPNLTPDDETGLGRWRERDIVRALITGVGTDGHQRLPVMPWPNYGALSDKDLTAIARYLKSLPPVRYQVPARTLPADEVAFPYVRFGIFVFTPLDEDGTPMEDVP